MPYSVGEKGSHGCSGYPVIKTATGEVMGCHPTVGDANKQLAALHINEPNATKSVVPANPSQSPIVSFPGVGVKYPDVNPRKYSNTKRRRRIGISPNAQENSLSGTVVSGGSGGSMSSKNDNVDIWAGSAFEKRDYSPKARERMASSGEAMPDGSYPIANRKDLMNAIRSWGRGGADPKVKAHIISRARALGASDMIPENWK